jgi:hypothetical protein
VVILKLHAATRLALTYLSYGLLELTPEETLCSCNSKSQKSLMLIEVKVARSTCLSDEAIYVGDACEEACTVSLK